MGNVPIPGAYGESMRFRFRLSARQLEWPGLRFRERTRFVDTGSLPAHTVGVKVGVKGKRADTLEKRLICRE